jgi:Leu/Phe-tRNA-protein transferase
MYNKDKKIIWVDENIKNILKKEAQRTNSDMNKVITLLVESNINKVVQESPEAEAKNPEPKW